MLLHEVCQLNSSSTLVPALQAVIKVISEARGDMSSPDQLQTLAHGLVPSRPEHYAAQVWLMLSAIDCNTLLPFFHSGNMLCY